MEHLEVMASDDSAIALELAMVVMPMGRAGMHFPCAMAKAKGCSPPELRSATNPRRSTVGQNLVFEVVGESGA
jgi:hypothetical protein